MPVPSNIQLRAQAELELRRRADAEINEASYKQARQNLIRFTEHTYPQYVTEDAHALMADYLDDVLDGYIDRLMIFAPPQHGKSELVSVRFPAYFLGHSPDSLIILTSYGATLAHEKSRLARDVVESPEFNDLFPGIHTSRIVRASDNWRIQSRKGGVVAAGVGGAITGRGGPLGIIDDPIENWQQAQSATYRKRAWEWYRYTFRTRIHEGGCIILVMTRWHEDDLAGKLLEADDANRWVVARLPALAETQKERNDNNERLGIPSLDGDLLGRQAGEALCPSRFSAYALRELEQDLGTYGFSSEYQGVPLPAQGHTFQYDWFNVVDAAPDKVDACVRYWDKAGTEAGGKRTAGVKVSRAGTKYYVEHTHMGQWSAGRREDNIKRMAELDAVLDWNEDNTAYTVVDPGPTIWIEQEPAASGKESALATIANLAGFVCRADRVSGSKEVRANPFAVQCEAGNVFLVRGPWNNAFIREYTSFPYGAFSDQVDAGSGAFNKVAAHKRRRKARQHEG